MRKVRREGSHVPGTSHTLSGEQELTSSAEKALSELTGACPARMLEQSTRDFTGSLSTPSLSVLYSRIS